MTILTAAQYELRQIIRKPSVFFMLFILPLLLIFILGTSLASDFKRENQELPPVKIGLWGANQSRVSVSLERYLKQPDVAGFIQTVFLSSKEEMDERLKKGSILFGVSILEGVPGRDGSSMEFMLHPGPSEEANLTAKVLIEQFIAQSNDELARSEESGAAERSKPDERIRFERMERSGTEGSATQYYSAAYLIMFLLFSGMSAAIGILTEKENNTFARICAMPVRPWQFILGKLLGICCFCIFQALFLIGMTTLLFNVSWGSFGWLAVICALTIIAGMSLGFLVALVVKSRKTMEPVFTIIVFAMTFFSGGMVSGLSDTIRSIGLFTINHWAADSVLRLMQGGDASIVRSNTVVLGLIAAGLLMLALMSSRKAAFHE